jgi:hypothetical protein
LLLNIRKQEILLKIKTFNQKLFDSELPAMILEEDGKKYVLCGFTLQKRKRFKNHLTIFLTKEEKH